MNRPCKTTIECRLFPGEVDSPVLNVSAEAPDQLIFIGWGYTKYNPYVSPRIGNGQFFARDCEGTQFSVLSQEIADLIAAIEAENCQQGGDGLQFSNSIQTASISCASGDLFTYTVQSGTFVSPIFPVLNPNASTPEEIANQEAAIEAWIEAANARALAYAHQQASAQNCCLSINNTTACVTIPIPSGGFLITGHSNNTTNVYTMEVIGGTLPPGLTFVQTGNLTAELQGTPNHIGSFTFEVNATSVSASTQKTFTVLISNCVPVPCGPVDVTLPDATAGFPYSQQLPDSGAPGPFTFTADPFTLPLWIDSVSPSGLITSVLGPDTGDAGTTFTFGVTVTNSVGGVCNEQVTIEVFEISNCDFAPLFALMIDPGSGTPSSAPPWDGIFNLQTTYGGSSFPVWYFIGKSLFGWSVSADEVPGYIAPPPQQAWASAGNYFQLYWDGSEWVLHLESTDGGTVFWEGNGGTNILDPSGDFVYGFGTGPATGLKVTQISTGVLCLSLPCVPDSGVPVPASACVAIAPVVVSSVSVGIADTVGSPVTFAPTPGPGCYRIEYVSGYFERLRNPTAQPPDSDRFTNYNLGPGVAAVHSDMGNMQGVREPCDVPDVVIGTQALNPVGAGIGMAAGTSINMWSDDTWLSCTSDVQPTTGSINYNLVKYGSIPERVRVVPADLFAFLTALGICPACDPATVEPVWDGTMPVVVVTSAFVVSWFSLSFNLNGKKALAQLDFVTGSHWKFQILCDFASTIVWEAHKTVGTSPTGTYMKFNPSPGYNCVTGPDCVHVEIY